MPFPKRSRVSLITLLFIHLLSVSFSSAQKLPPLPGSTSAGASVSTSQGSATVPPALTSASGGSAPKGLPALTSSSGYDGPTDLPTLTNPGGGYGGAATYSYPPPTVPPTNDGAAPYLQQSFLPEGTIFICVGAALGFFAFVVLAWRAVVAWSIHRSSRRTAAANAYGYGHLIGDLKVSLGVSPPRGGAGKPYYSQGAGSNLSLEHLGHSTTGLRAPPSQSSGLFFSPTAGVGASMTTKSGNRGSAYLPAGYYAAGGAAPGGGTASRPVSQAPLIGPQSGTYQRADSVDASPPESPGLFDGLPPRRGAELPYGQSSTIMGTGVGGASSSTLNLQGGRTPSIYLDEMFDSHPPGPSGYYHD
ncbi:MAG: hypothetical protein MMC33_010321 [Icmadophila ericetorum]|nr:hypothetical protein [Icmadophila ericetorum]